MPRVKRNSFSAAALLLCTALASPGSTAEAEKETSKCALKCDVSPAKAEAKCTLPADPQKLNCSSEIYSNILRNISSLDLSDNKLTEVPDQIFHHCENLTELSLARNNIEDIKSEAFASLSNLKTLNLSFNDLRDWKVNPTNELQGLNDLDVTGNQHWLPSEQLLQLSNLTTVKGVRLSRYCQDCCLCKMSASADEGKSLCPGDRLLGSSSTWQSSHEIQYGKALDFIKLRFWPSCLLDYACLIDQYLLPLTKVKNAVTIKASSALYATGSVALLVNIAVVVFIALNKSLRANLAVRLVLNIAVCDVLIGLVSISQARFNWGKMDIEYYLNRLQGKRDSGNKSKTLVNIMGPTLTCAVASQVFGSFISMLEKFFKVVFAMKPDVRLGKKNVLAFLLFSWSLSVTFAVLPVFSFGMMSYVHPYLGITPLPTDKMTITYEEVKQPVGFAAGSQIALVIFQLTSFVLYLPIFIVAKKSGANVGIKREAAIARKIALLVFSNLIFFTVPVAFIAFKSFIALEITNLSRYTLGELKWSAFAATNLSMLCLSINSVLNPFLYALRHPKIRQQLDPLLSRCRAGVGECFAQRQNLRCHLTPVEPTNEMEMREVKMLQSPSHTDGQNKEVGIQDTRL